MRFRYCLSSNVLDSVFSPGLSGTDSDLAALTAPDTLGVVLRIGLAAGFLGAPNLVFVPETESVDPAPTFDAAGCTLFAVALALRFWFIARN